MFKITKEELENAVKVSDSFRDVAIKFNTGHHTIKRYVDNYGIDYSHFIFGKSYDHLIGQRFGKLTVKSIQHKEKGKRFRLFVLCKCDCGKEKLCRADSLKSGRYVSCGCHSKNRWNMVCEKNPAFTGVGELRSAYYGEIIKSAKRRDLEFNVSKEYLWDLYVLQNGKCALTGLDIKFGRVHNRHETTASLDRIDNTKGYVEGNLRWVLKDINMLRADYDTEYFIKLCNLVAKNNPRDLGRF